MNYTPVLGTSYVSPCASHASSAGGGGQGSSYGTPRSLGYGIQPVLITTPRY